ncbi:hypothetical protein HDU84_000049 [Entophlyctis sp. JEL0112]|nr:hypothetical protein HDU84_000049 [Entophlyctis sp. JEL0112]
MSWFSWDSVPSMQEATADLSEARTLGIPIPQDSRIKIVNTPSRVAFEMHYSHITRLYEASPIDGDDENVLIEFLPPVKYPQEKTVVNVKKTNIPYHIDQMLKYWNLELENFSQWINENGTNSLIDDECSVSPGSCAEFLLERRVLQTLVTISSTNNPPGILVPVVRFFIGVFLHAQSPLRSCTVRMWGVAGKPIMDLIYACKTCIGCIENCGASCSAMEEVQAIKKSMIDLAVVFVDVVRSLCVNDRSGNSVILDFLWLVSSDRNTKDEQMARQDSDTTVMDFDPRGSGLDAQERIVRFDLFDVCAEFIFDDEELIASLAQKCIEDLLDIFGDLVMDSVHESHLFVLFTEYALVGSRFVNTLVKVVL